MPPTPYHSWLQTWLLCKYKFPPPLLCKNKFEKWGGGGRDIALLILCSGQGCFTHFAPYVLQYCNESRSFPRVFQLNICSGAFANFVFFLSLFLKMNFSYCKILNLAKLARNKDKICFLKVLLKGQGHTFDLAKSGIIGKILMSRAHGRPLRK